MVDMSAIAGLAQALTAAVNITKAMKDFHDANLIQTQVYQLTGEIMSAQQAALAALQAQNDLINRVRELEDEKAELEAWNAQKERYQLKDYGGGTFAYELKQESAQGEPIHRICPKCYGEGHAALLQFPTRDAFLRDVYRCARVVFSLGPRQRWGTKTPRPRST